MNLSVKIFMALLLSVVVGLFINPDSLPFIKEWIEPLGTIFINLIKMMIVPVVFFSLVVGITSLGNMTKLGRIGLKTVAIYLCTTAIAITIGLIITGIVQPGVGLSMVTDAEVKVKEAPALMQVFVGMIPSSPVEAMAKVQLLPIIVFAIFVSIGILKTGTDRSEIIIKFFSACAEVSYKIIGVIMDFAPIGVFAMLLPVVIVNGAKALLPLLSVILCLAVGCILHAAIVYSSLVRIKGGISPIKFYKGISEAMLLAFTTCSSAATLPVSMKNCQENLGVHREISSFVLPLGATINMDGAALYMGVSSIFIANVFGIDLTMNQMIMIVLTGTLASIGSAGVPGSGLIMLVMVLNSAGLPLEGLALVAGIDRILDMFRTCLNITGDAAVACIINEDEKNFQKHNATVTNI